MLKSKWKRKLEESRDWAGSRAEAFKNISLSAKDDEASNLYWDVAQAYSDVAKHIEDELRP